MPLPQQTAREGIRTAPSLPIQIQTHYLASACPQMPSWIVVQDLPPVPNRDHILLAHVSEELYHRMRAEIGGYSSSDIQQWVDLH